MSRWRAALLRLMRPGWGWRAALTLFCVPALWYVLSQGMHQSVLAYGVYTLSAYTLFIWGIQIPGAIRRTREIMEGHPLTGRYLTDASLRGRLGLCLSLAVNTCYALFKLGIGIYYRSFWSGAIAVYDLILAGMRGLLLRGLYRSGANRREELQTARRCGWLLFALNLALSAVTVQMVMEGKGYTYPGALIFAAAAYAFYSVTASVFSLIRLRKLNSPVLSASKVLGLASALVSMLSLQTAMFAAFGGEYSFQRQMNALTGGGVCLAVFAMAAGMVVRTGREQREIAGPPALRLREAFPGESGRIRSKGMEGTQLEQESKSFSYTYSPKQRQEIQRIRQKYLPPEEDKMERLRRLDKSAARPGKAAALGAGGMGTLVLGVGMCCTMVWTDYFVPGIVIGVIGLLGVGGAYPLYSVIAKRQRKKLAPQIMELSRELLDGE